MTSTTAVRFQSGALSLEGVTYSATVESEAIAVVCHPHPQHGGTSFDQLFHRSLDPLCADVHWDVTAPTDLQVEVPPVLDALGLRDLLEPHPRPAPRRIDDRLRNIPGTGRQLIGPSPGGRRGRPTGMQP